MTRAACSHQLQWPARASVINSSALFGVGLLATEPALPKPGDIVGGKYRVERQLGSGGMGVVYQATHRVTNKRFAIKWLLPDVAASQGALKRFIREAQVAGRFEHPNVVEVYDIGQDGTSYFMVMELLEGEALADRMERLRKLSPQQICEILVPCMEGVAAAHEVGIIHRDLKPANIFVCAARGRHPEHPKVLDFGISKLAPMQGVMDATLTHAGAVMGTPHYMAPEQMRAQPVDRRADIYAFGVILYQALSGQRPFNGENYVDLVLQVMHEQPKPLRELRPDIPLALANVVERAMAREPAARFTDLQELVSALAPYHRAQSTHPLGASAFPASDHPGAAAVAAGRADERRPLAASQPETPLFSESMSIPSPSPIKLPSHRTQLWLAGAFGTVLVVVFIAAVLSRPSISEPSTAHRVVPARAPLSDDIDPRPAIVRVEPEEAAVPRLWVPPDVVRADASVGPTIEVQQASPASAEELQAPSAAVAPLPPTAAGETKQAPLKKPSAARRKPGTPRVKLDLNDFTSDEPPRRSK